MIQSNRLTKEQHTVNFSDIHPRSKTADAALVEANRCLFWRCALHKELPYRDRCTEVHQTDRDGEYQRVTHDLHQQYHGEPVAARYARWKNSAKDPAYST